MKHILILFMALSVTVGAAQQATSGNINSQSNKASASESPAKEGQTPGSPGQQAQSGASESSSAQQQTISGCLNQSGTAYTLTDSQTGTVYQLSGNTTHLSSHVGHEIQIAGNAKNRPNENATGAPSGNSAKRYVFQVSTTKHLADQCGPSPATANGPSL